MSNRNQLHIDFDIFKNTESNDDDDCNANECKSIHRIITGLVYYQTLNNNTKNNYGNDDKHVRYSWDLGSMVSIFSRSKNQWFKAYIDDIYIDPTTNKEWLIVKYGQNKKKTIQRLCKDIKPITDDMVNTIFSDFLCEKYKHYLNDIIHFNTKHQMDLEVIHDKILCKHTYYKPCDINNCSSSSRHCSTNDQGNNDKTKQDISGLCAFHIKTWDALHYQLNHLWETGLRHRITENKLNSHDPDEINLTDDKMNEQNVIITRNRAKLGRLFGRFGSDHNKFTITTVNESISSFVTSGSDTRMDMIYKYLSESISISNEEVLSLVKFIKVEQYDTESLFYDVGQDDKQNSNILHSTQSEIFVNILYQYIKYKIGIVHDVFLCHYKIFILLCLYAVSSNSFSSGYSFIYHKDMLKGRSNDICHDSYTWSDLFIESGKYSCLKEEILSNRDNEIEDTKTWTDNVILKANQFKHTRKLWEIGDEEQYAFVYNLHPIILYCDFSMLSTSFTATFRKMHEMESLQEIKQRNKCYYHLAKALYVTVQEFGSSQDETLYSGMSVMLNMANSNLYLRGPTSTSTELIIAQNFSQNTGIILELSSGGGGPYEGDFERRFDASWVSRYPEEAERIFMFGDWSLKLVSIRINIRNVWMNYEIYYQVMYCIELMTNGEYMGTEEDSISSKKHVLVSKALLCFNNSIPEYVRNCWLLFVNNTKTLNINYHNFKYYPEYLLLLMFVGDYKQEEYGEHVSDDVDLDVNVNQNMINPNFLEVFNNIITVNITCGHTYKYYYPFSLMVFIEAMMKMQKRHQIKIVLKAEWYKNGVGDYTRRSWLFYHFRHTFSSNILLINSKKQDQSLKEYFIDYNCDENDTNVYSTIMKLNKKSIKIEITVEDHRKSSKKDILSFIC